MRYRFVEFIGPSGVGKSTLYDELKCIWHLNDKWVPFEELYSEAKWVPKRILRPYFRVGREFFQSPYDSLDQKVLYRGSLGFESHLPHLLSDEDKELKSVIMDLIHHHASGGYGSTDRRFFVMSNIMWIMSQYHALKEKAPNNKFVIPVGGELFASQSMHFSNSNMDYDMLYKFIDSIPKPEIVFHMSIPLEKLMDRIMKRDRKSTIHRNLNLKELERMNKDTIQILDSVVERLKSKHKSGVVTLDMTLPVKEQVKIVTKKLNES